MDYIYHDILYIILLKLDNIKDIINFTSTCSRLSSFRTHPYMKYILRDVSIRQSLINKIERIKKLKERPWLLCVPMPPPYTKPTNLNSDKLYKVIDMNVYGDFIRAITEELYIYKREESYVKYEYQQTTDLSITRAITDIIIGLRSCDNSDGITLSIRDYSDSPCVATNTNYLDLNDKPIPLMNCRWTSVYTNKPCIVECIIVNNWAHQFFNKFRLSEFPYTNYIKGWGWVYDKWMWSEETYTKHGQI